MKSTPILSAEILRDPQPCSRRDLARLGCVALWGCAAAPVFTLAGCATQTGVALRQPAAAQAGSDVALFALSLLDKPYVSGGRGPATGFDCSGLVAHVYLQAAGIKLQGNAASMARAARPIDAANLAAGDLLFFNTLGYTFSHVGIFVGEGRFVHASNPRTGVRTDALASKYYSARFEGARTILG